MSGLHSFDRRAVARPRAAAQTAWTSAPALDIAAIVQAFARARGEDALRRGLPALLAGWICYALVVETSIHSLNRLSVPVLGLRLGSFLALQGTLALFVIALRLFARAGSGRPRGGRTAGS